VVVSFSRTPLAGNESFKADALLAGRKFQPAGPIDSLEVGKGVSTLARP